MPNPAHEAQRVPSVRAAVLTISDSRTESTDKSGTIIKERLGSAGHTVQDYAILPDDPQQVRKRVSVHCQEANCQAVLLNGGTGIAPRDTTIEAIETLFEKRLDGFSELFRMLSFEEIGAAAMLSRAAAGVCQDTIIFAMPGSPGAVKLAMDRLVLPTLGHAVWLLEHH